MVTRISNRIRGLLTQIHPPLERVLGPKLQHPAVVELLSPCGGPAGIRKAGRAKLLAIVKARARASYVTQLLQGDAEVVNEGEVVPELIQPERQISASTANFRQCRPISTLA